MFRDTLYLASSAKLNMVVLNKDYKMSCQSLQTSRRVFAFCTYRNVSSWQEYGRKNGDIFHGVAVFERGNTEGFRLVCYFDGGLGQCRHLNVFLHG